MQSGSSSAPLTRSLAGSSPATFANLKLNAKWLARSAFQADPIGFESRQLRRALPSWWNKQTRYAQNVVTRVVRVQILPRVPIAVAEGEVNSPRAVTPL